MQCKTFFVLNAWNETRRAALGKPLSSLCLAETRLAQVVIYHLTGRCLGFCVMHSRLLLLTSFAKHGLKSPNALGGLTFKPSDRRAASVVLSVAVHIIHTCRAQSGAAGAGSALVSPCLHLLSLGLVSVTTLKDCSHSFLPLCQISNFHVPGINSHCSSKE